MPAERPYYAPGSSVITTGLGVVFLLVNEMIPSDAVGLFAGAVALGAVHGVEPGHGWPVAASYALDQSNKWLYGFAASLILGVGHLVSSIAMVLAFFFAKSYFELTEINEPLAVAGVEIGGPVGIAAGILLILLGIREYRHGGHGHAHAHATDGEGGGSHDHGGDHDGMGTHSHGHHGDESGPHGHDHGGGDGGIVGKLRVPLPSVGGDHDHGSSGDATDRGLWGIAGFAFVLGFAHEEEFEIIALCAGSEYCLSLMSTYALTVIAGIVSLTLLLIVGYERYEQRVERYTDYLPVFSAAVLIAMGVGFVAGLF
jgi:ABC-type nickel/cobalt efflux system permease component RcnA